MKAGLACPYRWDGPGGVQQHIWDLAEALMGLMHEASVISPAGDDKLPPGHVVPAGRAVPVPCNGARRAIRQPRQATAAGIPGQPLMDCLPRHPIAAGHLSNCGAFLEHFQHSPVPLLHHTQLHQHTQPPCLRPLIDRRQAPRMLTSREPGRSVAHLPELLSASYRNRVRKLSPRNRNQGVHDQPESHNSLRSERRSYDGQMILRVAESIRNYGLTCCFVEPPYGIEP
jgi:hypothetical protein